MAFVNWVPNNSGYSGVEVTTAVGDGSAEKGYKIGVVKSPLNSSLQGLFSPATNTSGMVKPFSGWIAYTGGGGGPDPGPTRPTTGMLYPRGQG